ncbi:hypothetical protein AeMF1_005222 [Aphanomyces euteiches]|nr:hypothetical protein AeMF1_005222 [Aphanomyces euteiches]
MSSSIAVTAAAIAAAVACVATLDGRSFRSGSVQTYSFRTDTWTTIKNNESASGWFKRNLRCTKRVFEIIVGLVEEKWNDIHESIHHNALFGISDRVAITIHYLTHTDGYDQTALVFGTSKTRAYVYVNQVVAVLNVCYLHDVIRMPSKKGEWNEVCAEFEALCGFPNAYGAIDGTLIHIKRFADFDGWYCRKGFPAFNMQGVVDARLRFRSYSLRSGSQNDKAVFNNSRFGKKYHRIVPPGGCFLGDAGYKLFKHIITPYPIVFEMPDDESHFNLVHSRTRMVVEQAFGLWKNTFRIFKTPLLHGTPEQMAHLIQATLVLHNWFIDFKQDTDRLKIPKKKKWMHVGGDLVYPDEINLIDGPRARASRDTIKDYLYVYVVAD